MQRGPVEGAISDAARMELERAMRRRDLTAKSLAELVGVSASYVSRVKNQRQRPTLQLLQDMANALRIDATVLAQQDLRWPMTGAPRRMVMAELRQLRQSIDRWIELLAQEDELELRVAERPDARYALVDDGDGADAKLQRDRAARRAAEVAERLSVRAERAARGAGTNSGSAREGTAGGASTRRPRKSGPERERP